ncbi:MAG: phenylalanine--tRNA ligase subunit beta, partial [Myxococcales bacterium]|nr:phenylalanine--tRNA ligase subunit beta [Myxococcales bacterium]
DDVERTLTADDLLICDGEGPVAVAGVMGGADSEMGEGTRDVLIECAYFDPRSVRRTSRRLGLHTEASHRFERGVDPSAVRAVLARAATLLAELGGGAVVPDGLDVVARSIEAPSVVLCHARMARLLGVEVPPAFTRRVLEGIGCEVLDDAAAAIEVRVPSHRPDLAMEADLIEEVARIYGYDRVPTAVPRVRPSKDGTPVSIRFDRRLREAAAAGAGLTEAITYAFVAPGALEAARVSTQAVPLHNPLSEERSVMRTSLLPGLLANVARARRHQAGTVTLFELARVYHPVDGEALPSEPLHLAVAMAGPRVDHVSEAAAYDFYDGKGVLGSVVEATLGAQLEAVTDDALDAEAPFLHPRRRARLVIDGTPVGVLGELHPDIGDDAGLDVRMVYGELDVDRLLEVSAARGVPQARALPRFPAVSRDLALVVDEPVEVGAVAAALEGAGVELVEAIELFDVYRGTGIEPGKKSLAFRVVYRDAEATLTDKKVDQAHRRVVDAAVERFGAKLRG